MKKIQEVEIKKHRNYTEWLGRPTSNFLLPSEEVKNDDLLIDKTRHRFQHRLAKNLKIDPFPVEQTKASLQAIFDERETIFSKKKHNKETKQQKLQQIKIVQLNQAILLIKQNFNSSYIQQFFHIPKQMIGLALSRIRNGLPAQFLKNARKPQLSEIELCKIAQASKEGELEILSSNQIQNKLLGRGSKQTGQLTKHSFTKYREMFTYYSRTDWAKVYSYWCCKRGIN